MKKKKKKKKKKKNYHSIIIKYYSYWSSQHPHLCTSQLQLCLPQSRGIAGNLTIVLTKPLYIPQTASLVKSLFNPIVLRKAKFACNFGLSECNRVKSPTQALCLAFGITIIVPCILIYQPTKSPTHARYMQEQRQG